MPEVSRMFRRSALVRERESFAVGPGTQPTMAIVSERSSLGVNLTGMMDAAWLVPLRQAARENPEQSVRAALSQLESAGHQLLMTPSNIDPECVARCGLQHLTSAYYYAINRAGIGRYSRFMADAFGELNARQQDRRRKHE